MQSCATGWVRRAKRMVAFGAVMSVLQTLVYKFPARGWMLLLEKTPQTPITRSEIAVNLQWHN